MGRPAGGGAGARGGLRANGTPSMRDTTCTRRISRLDRDVAGHSPFGFRFRDYHVVVDERGNLVAGEGFVDEGFLSSKIRQQSPRAEAREHRPSHDSEGRRLTRVAVDGLWFAAGRPGRAALLWEWMRWLAHDRASLAMIFFDHAPACPCHQDAPLIPSPRHARRQRTGSDARGSPRCTPESDPGRRLGGVASIISGRTTSAPDSITRTQ